MVYTSRHLYALNTHIEPCKISYGWWFARSRLPRVFQVTSSGVSLFDVMFMIPFITAHSLCEPTFVMRLIICYQSKGDYIFCQVCVDLNNVSQANSLNTRSEVFTHTYTYRSLLNL